MTNACHKFPEPKVTFSNYLCPTNHQKTTIILFTMLKHKKVANCRIRDDETSHLWYSCLRNEQNSFSDFLSMDASIDLPDILELATSNSEGFKKTPSVWSTYPLLTSSVRATFLLSTSPSLMYPVTSMEMLSRSMSSPALSPRSTLQRAPPLPASCRRRCPGYR